MHTQGEARGYISKDLTMDDNEFSQGEITVFEKVISDFYEPCKLGEHTHTRTNSELNMMLQEFAPGITIPGNIYAWMINKGYQLHNDGESVCWLLRERI